MLFKSTSLIATFSLLVAPYVNACMFHDQPGFTGHGALQGLVTSQPAQKFNAISVLHPSKVAVEKQKDQSINLDYYVPSSIRKASIRVMPSAGVTLLNGDEFALVNSRGVLNLSYTINNPGAHSITLSINGQNGFSALRKIQFKQRIVIHAF